MLDDLIRSHVGTHLASEQVILAFPLREVPRRLAVLQTERDEVHVADGGSALRDVSVDTVLMKVYLMNPPARSLLFKKSVYSGVGSIVVGDKLGVLDGVAVAGVHSVAIAKHIRPEGQGVSIPKGQGIAITLVLHSSLAFV